MQVVMNYGQSDFLFLYLSVFVPVTCSRFVSLFGCSFRRHHINFFTVEERGGGLVGCGRAMLKMLEKVVAEMENYECR